MADIQHWRRMIPRALTPAVEIEESDGVLSPNTTRRGLKPKISSYFAQHNISAGPSKTDLLLTDDLLAPPWPIGASPDDDDDEETHPKPDPEILVESVMTRLLAEPQGRLDARFNGIILQIFEAFREAMDEKRRLTSELQDEIERRHAAEQAMHHTIEHWEQDRKSYKAEVKRLEVLLSKGKRGLTEVTLARQDSVIRHSGVQVDQTMENIFQYLEKSKKYDEKVWGLQRATMRKRPLSPSVAMKRLSRTLTKQSLDGHPDIDFAIGAPPDAATSTPLQESMLQDDAPTAWSSNTLRRPTLHVDTTALDRPTLDPVISASDSTWSCTGDLLPDELTDARVNNAAVPENDFATVRRIAQVLARSRRVDADSVMPKLQELFNTHSSDENSNTYMAAQDSRGNTPRSRAAKPSNSTESLRVSRGIHLGRSNTSVAEKNNVLAPKKSGFLAKFRPQLNIDTTSANAGHRFSFEPGDDSAATLNESPMDVLPATVKDRLLRKSVSTSVLSEKAAKVIEPGRCLSPVEQSPTTSAPLSESKRPTRIPTPVYSNATLARPRQEREDSTSSLLTAIRRSDAMSQRASSVSSSVYSSPSSSRNDLTQGLQSGGNNPLLERTNTRRSNGVHAAVPARPATRSIDLDQLKPSHHFNHAGESSGGRSSRLADMGELRMENVQPMIPKSSYFAEQDDSRL